MTKVAFITGVSSGIGQACTLAFIRDGVHVIGVARRQDRLDALSAEIAALPAPHGNFLGLIGDVTDAASLESAVQTGVSHFGRLDILVANAGVGHRGAIADSEWADIQTVLRTNIDGVMHSVRAVIPAMRQNGSGHIITISSVTYNLVSPYAATYAASKAFVSSLANSLRLELEDDHIRVTDVLVGRTHTEFNSKRLGEGKRTGEGVPTMTPETVAAAIVKATHRPKNTLILRLFDRLLVWGNILIPGIIGRMARKQYR
jgi:NADP-dependent 3-hydroxy acid dehydrogenase YdfG